jgi:Cytochrome b5-like Heme/Steroid binding domain
MTDAKSVTQGELEKHTDEKDCWLAIHGKVYDVSSYLVDHPGGLDVMMEYAGVCALVRDSSSFVAGSGLCLHPLAFASFLQPDENFS